MVDKTQLYVCALTLAAMAAACDGSDHDSRTSLSLTGVEQYTVELDEGDYPPGWAGTTIYAAPNADAWDFDDDDVTDGVDADGAGHTDDAAAGDDTSAGWDETRGEDIDGADAAEGDDAATGGPDTDEELPPRPGHSTEGEVGDGGVQWGDTGPGGDDGGATTADTTAEDDTAPDPGDTQNPEDSDAGGPTADTGPEPSEDVAPEPDLPDPTPGLAVTWCRTWHPASIYATASAPRTVSAHVYVPGLTDETSNGPDPAPWLHAEVGWGPAYASAADEPDAFVWTAAAIDSAPPSWVFHAHDRYVAELSIPTPGLYGYVTRFSADSGVSWLYCDLDGSNDGFEVDEMGRAEIVP